MNKLAIIGTGNMGTALIRAIINTNFCPASDITIFDLDTTKTSALATELGVKTATEILEAVKDVYYIMLCVKPNNIADVCNIIKSTLKKEQIILSIAAGITISSISSLCEETELKCARIMPNTPAQICKGASGVSFSESVTPEEEKYILNLLTNVGIAEKVNEKDMDAVTGLSGSGPAYIFAMIEAMILAGVKNGLTEETATKLASQTALGAASMLKSTGLTPKTLREQVTSPNGTTAAGLKSLQDNGFSDSIYKAITAATKRSVELSNN